MSGAGELARLDALAVTLEGRANELPAGPRWWRRLRHPGTAAVEAGMALGYANAAALVRVERESVRRAIERDTYT